MVGNRVIIRNFPACSPCPLHPSYPMLTYHHHRKPVHLSLISTDLPIWSVVNTAATLARKDHERFNLLITEPPLLKERSTQVPAAKNPRLLWLEISPYQVIMTRQASGQLNYRHFWEQGVYGDSLYWLNSEFLQDRDTDAFT